MRERERDLEFGISFWHIDKHDGVLRVRERMRDREGERMREGEKEREREMENILFKLVFCGYGFRIA